MKREGTYEPADHPHVSKLTLPAKLPDWVHVKSMHQHFVDSRQERKVGPHFTNLKTEEELKHHQKALTLLQEQESYPKPDLGPEEKAKVEWLEESLESQIKKMKLMTLQRDVDSFMESINRIRGFLHECGVPDHVSARS